MAEKDFKGSFDAKTAAMSFLSDTKPEESTGQEQQKEKQEPKVYTLEEAAEILRKTKGAALTENKSRRLHLMVTPTFFAELKAEARRLDISINALANEILVKGMQARINGNAKG